MSFIDYLKGKKVDGVEMSREKMGNVPGNMVFTGEQKVEKSSIHYFEYGPKMVKAETLTGKEFMSPYDPKDTILQWYDIRGLHEIDVISKVSNAFHVHPLIQEDIVDVQQRPKFEEYPDGIYIVLNPLNYDEELDMVNTEIVSIYFGEEFLLSFQENSEDVFTEVRNRINEDKGIIRKKGVDYLAYALIDKVVDSYIFMMEQIEDDLEDLELEIINDPSDSVKDRIHHFKTEMIKIRKAVTPLKEAVDKFRRSEHKLINKETKIYIRDVYDHIAQVQDSAENFKDRLNGLQELFISEVSYKMNKAMQFLTIITAIFVPLSFLVGLYGMNFEYMPELKYQNGYHTLLGVMAILVLGMIAYFKRKKWL